MSRSRKPSETPPARIAPLSTLPLFFELDGRRAVVAGGTAAAAWKAELMAAAGAEVVMLADALDDEARACIADKPSIRHIARAWRPNDLLGAAVVVADAASDDEAADLSGAASAQGVPCNIIDRPRWCDFTFGSVVNRSPVVVGISTGGAAPVLGQAIRRRIETMLPGTLAGWAERARSIRTEVMQRFPDFGARRAFWSRFADKALSGQSCVDDSGAHDRPEETSGRVTLVGAGPGDAELLTLKAVRALQSADVILFDALVSDDVLELARREARRMLVGKRGGRPSCRQEDINATMLKLARQGRHVVRLKAGDPMVFGRAGEEIDALHAAGIPVEVVPGITAASAAAARLQVSLTHRDHAQGVRFVTGHARNGELPDDLDWCGLADAKTTLMVYMGGRTANRLAGRLLAAGMPSHTPAATITAVSRPAEELRLMTLGSLAQHDFSGVDEPVLIGIGRVFAALTAANTDASRAASIA